MAGFWNAPNPVPQTTPSGYDRGHDSSSREGLNAIADTLQERRPRFHCTPRCSQNAVVIGVQVDCILKRSFSSSQMRKTPVPLADVESEFNFKVSPLEVQRDVLTGLSMFPYLNAIGLNHPLLLLLFKRLYRPPEVYVKTVSDL